MGIALARLVALALAALGVGALAAPKFSARAYGLPSEDATALAFVQATGARDLVLGIIVAALAKESARDGLTSVIAASTLVAAADFSLVARSDTPAAKRALVIHGSGMAGLLVLWAILRSRR